MGYTWLKLGQFAQANHYLQHALTLTHRIGDRSTEWWLAAVVARLYHFRNETERGLTFALQHYSVAQHAGDARVLTYLADTLTLLYAQNQAGAESLQWAQWMQEHAHQKQQWRYQVRALIRLAQAHLLLGQSTHAFNWIEKSIQRYTSKHQPLDEEPELFATYAQCATAVGNLQLAVSAQHKAHQSLQAQVDAIPNPVLRQSFLSIQQIPQDCSTTNI